MPTKSAHILIPDIAVLKRSYLFRLICRQFEQKPPYKTISEIISDISGIRAHYTSEITREYLELFGKTYTDGYLEASKELAGAKRITPAAPDASKALESALPKILSRMSNIYPAVFPQLDELLKDALERNMSYEEVSGAVERILKNHNGNTLKFQSAGKLVNEVKVSPEGRLTRSSRLIKQNRTMSTKAYSALFARTVYKGCRVAGKIDAYSKTKGVKGWVYNCVSDERSRPQHIALHGRHFVYGTEESDMALEVMQDYNCRCRPAAWFDDPELDTPEDEYATERSRIAFNSRIESTSQESNDYLTKVLENSVGPETLRAYDAGKIDHFINDIVLQSPKNVQELCSCVEQSVKKNLPRVTETDRAFAAAYNKLGVTESILAQDIAMTLQGNFAYSKARKEYGFAHIYKKHIQNQYEGFTISEVLEAKVKGTKFWYYNEGSGKDEIVSLYEFPDNRKMKVVLSTKKPKYIVTAYLPNENRVKPEWDDVVRDDRRYSN